MKKAGDADGLIDTTRWEGSDREAVSVRTSAARALGGLGPRAAVDPLVHLLRHDESKSVRFTAAQALGAVGDTRAVPALVEALEDDDATVQVWAAFSLGRLRARAAVPSLVRLLDAPAMSVRWSAAIALLQIGDEAGRAALAAAEARSSWPRRLSFWRARLGFKRQPWERLWPT